MILNSCDAFTVSVEEMDELVVEGNDVLGIGVFDLEILMIVPIKFVSRSCEVSCFWMI